MAPRPEPTTDTAAEPVGTVGNRQRAPVDNHMQHFWFMERRSDSGVLTKDGVEQIALHRYKAGTYTVLDNYLNPAWLALTDMLPLWLAPNLVTTIGGGFCLLAYSVSTYYDVSMTGDVPDWVLVLNGFCQIVYFTLDCMDGKQARRTQSSSPLGQLFDHGVDSLGNISHLNIIQCILKLPPKQYLWVQAVLQFAFFQAQWEEYYTGILTHATGNVGVTEIMYAMGLWSMSVGLLSMRDMYSAELPKAVQDVNFPLRSVVVGSLEGPLRIHHVLTVGWVYMGSVLSALSFVRVAKKVRSATVFASAFSQLATPAAICIALLTVVPADDSIRYSSLSTALCLCFITIKIIVFSMARMAYASVQTEALPFFLVVAIVHYQPSLSTVLHSVLAAYYMVRLWLWTGSAIDQICTRLNIQLFRIPHPFVKSD